MSEMRTTADVCDKGVFWKSPLRPRTMLSLKKAFSAVRPDQVNERAQTFAAPCELIGNEKAVTAGERRRPRHRRLERRGRGPHGPAAGPLSRMAYEARGMPAVHPRPLVRLSWTNKIGPLRVLPTSTKEHLMAVTLYSGFVPVCVQLLTGLKTVLKKAEDHATTQKWDTAVVLNLRFYPDM